MELRGGRRAAGAGGVPVCGVNPRKASWRLIGREPRVRRVLSLKALEVNFCGIFS